MGVKNTDSESERLATCYLGTICLTLYFRQTQCENWSKHTLKWRTSVPTRSSLSTKGSLLTALTCPRCSTCSPWRYLKSVEFLGSTQLHHRHQSQRALRRITWVWKKSQVLQLLLGALVPCQRPCMWSKQCRLVRHTRLGSLSLKLSLTRKHRSKKAKLNLF